MDPTTLVTFLFKAPPEVLTVELLGSWDNFSTPYYMHHDRRRGRGFWSGCFHFKHIIFDGDKAAWTKPRSGGLKQGGTYWYYYRLNDAIEAFDDSQEHTTGCPLLPGQTVNVMDVPVEVENLPSRRRSATIGVVGTLADLHRTHTLDPDDKWAALEPPPISKVHERCISDLALNGRLETKPHSYRDINSSPPVSPIPTNKQLGVAVPRQPSAGNHSVRSNPGWSSAPPSRDGSSIFNAYQIDQHAADSASLAAFPLPSTHQAAERPITRDGRSAYRGFDFAFDDASTRRSTSRTGDEDFDGSSFVLESAESPPHSAYGSVDWRFTVEPAHYEAGDDHIEGGDKQHQDHHQRSASDDSQADATLFDLCSPTFSAATISSNGGGLNTPFRLSAGYSRNSAPHSEHASQQHVGGQLDPSASIEHITERLRQLGSEDSAGSLPSHVSGDTEEERPFIGHYALPIHDGIGNASATTLGKVSYSSGHASIAAHQDVPPLPTASLPLGRQAEDSFADSIFSELGYLGASIA